MKTKIGIILGRFQPFHRGHKKLLDHALESSDKLIIGIGSADKARTTNNPFTYQERVELINAWIPEEFKNNVLLIPVHDYACDDNIWIHDFKHDIKRAVIYLLNGSNENVTLHGTADADVIFFATAKPDGASKYISWMKPILEQDGIETNVLPLNCDVSSSDIRPHLYAIRRASDEIYGTDKTWRSSAQGLASTSYLMNRLYGDELDVEAIEKIDDLMFSIVCGPSKINDRTFADVVSDWMTEKKTKNDWKMSPYPPTFNTSDLVLFDEKLENVVLVQRAGYGRNFFSCPGGYIEQNETHMEAAVREFFEETGFQIDVNDPLFMFCGRINIDNPKRSNNGRIITIANVFVVKDKQKIIFDRNVNETMFAGWVNIRQCIQFEGFFHEDHREIIMESCVLASEKMKLKENET